MSARAPRVVVFGEALVDVFGDRRLPGGAPLNVAAHLNGFGTDALLLTRIGDDADGALVARRLDASGVPRGGVQVDPDRPTGRVDVSLDAAGVPTYAILADAAWDHIEAAAIERALRPLHAAQARPWIYHGTLALRSPASLHAWRRACEVCEGPRFVDLNWRGEPLDRHRVLAAVTGARVLKVGRDEWRLLCDWSNRRSRFAQALPPEGDRCDAAASLCRALAIGALLITDGDRGGVAVGPDGTVTAAVPAWPVERLVDTVGAGDAFCATVLHGLVAGWPLPLALARAARFASLVCGAAGALPEDPQVYTAQRRGWDAEHAA